MIYLKLFLSFLQIGLFSIGGGYAAMPLIKEQVVDINPWLTSMQFADIMAIAEMTPGPIAINCATFVGIRVGGILGAIVATFGCILPSCFIVITLAHFYYKYRDLKSVKGVLSGLRPAVIAMIASAGLGIFLLAVFGEKTVSAGNLHVDIRALLIFASGLFVLRKFKINPIYVMLSAGVCGMILYSVF
ncbi:MAG: chromate transporter [Lachnospiraceae bacterium]|nr:chromate transporter [Lachnospiraceae bacterium]